MLRKQLIELYEFLLRTYGPFSHISIDCSSEDTIKVQINNRTILQRDLSIKSIKNYLLECGG